MTFVINGTLTLPGLFLAFASLGHFLWLVGASPCTKVLFSGRSKQMEGEICVHLRSFGRPPRCRSPIYISSHRTGRDPETTKELVNSLMLAKRDRHLAFRPGQLFQPIEVRQTYLQFKKYSVHGWWSTVCDNGRQEVFCQRKQTIELRNAGGWA